MTFMAVWTLGLNHTTAPLDLRGRFAFAVDKLVPTLQGLRRDLSQRISQEPEAAILSTCNRTEIYCAADQAATKDTLHWLAQTGGVSAAELLAHTYVLEGNEAARHAFRVASGLDSMVLGEAQILGQLKDAVRAAEQAGALGITLNQLFQRSFAVAKEVRSSTEIGAHSISMASASVGLQAGAQSKAVVLLFMTREAFDKFGQSKGWTAGVDGSVAIVKVGVNGEIDTVTANQPVQALVLTNAGLMANLTAALPLGALRAVVLRNRQRDFHAQAAVFAVAGGNAAAVRQHHLLRNCQAQAVAFHVLQGVAAAEEGLEDRLQVGLRHAGAAPVGGLVNRQFHPYRAAGRAVLDGVAHDVFDCARQQVGLAVHRHVGTAAQLDGAVVGSGLEFGIGHDFVQQLGHADLFARLVDRAGLEPGQRQQRRHRDDTALRWAGAGAEQWTLIAQCFAGPPADGPARGALALDLAPALAPRLAQRLAGLGEHALADLSYSNLWLFRRPHDYRYHAGPWPCISGQSYDGQRHALPLFDVREASAEVVDALLARFACLYPLSAREAGHFDPARYRIETQRDDADYLYSAEQFRRYPGRLLQKKRNLMAQLQALHCVTAQPYTLALQGDALQVLQGWLGDKGKAAGAADDLPCREALALASQLGLSGFVYWADAQPAGFLLAETVQPGVVVVRFAKALVNCKGMAQYMFHHFALTAPGPVQWLNFEQDMGLANFRRTKLSYQPAQLIQKWRISQFSQES
eukprot:gene16283-18580_t